MIYCDMEKTAVALKSRLELIQKGSWGNEDFFKSTLYSDLIKSGLFLNLDPMPDYQLLYDFLEAKPHFYLTNVGRVHPQRVVSDKSKWIKDKMHPRPMYHTFNREQKTLFCEPEFTTPVLIDDCDYTCNIGERRGGFAIIHRSAEETIYEYNRLNLV